MGPSCYEKQMEGPPVCVGVKKQTKCPLVYISVRNSQSSLYASIHYIALTAQITKELLLLKIFKIPFESAILANVQ